MRELIVGHHLAGKGGQVHLGALGAGGGAAGRAAGAGRGAAAGGAAVVGLFLLHPHPDDAGGGQAGVLVGDGDGGAALAHGGDHALLVHGGNLLVAGLPALLAAGGLRLGLQLPGGPGLEQGEVALAQGQGALRGGLFGRAGGAVGAGGVGSGAVRVGAVGIGGIRGRQVCPGGQEEYHA